MRWFSVSAIVCLTSVVGVVQVAAAETVSYVNGYWFDGKNFEKKDMTVRDGMIVGTGHAARTVDLHGGYVLPGLAEAHNHNLQNCYLAPQMAQGYLERGILYSAQLFATDPAGLQCAPLFDSRAAPSTAFARIGITSSTGHPIGIARAGAKEAGLEMSFDQLVDGMLIADSASELQRKWKQFAKTKTDFVKVILVDEENGLRNARLREYDGFNGVTREVLKALVPLARAAGLRTVAHVDTAADFKLAADAGVDTIAHLPGYRIAENHSVADYQLTDDVVKTAAANAVAVIPTMAASFYHVSAHPKDAPAIAQVYLHNLRLLRKYKVRLLTGSDRFEGSVLDELKALDGTGLFQPAELINMSTSATARWMFPQRRVGCLEQGCEASFNVYDENPAHDLGRLAKPAMVVKQGAVVAVKGKAAKPG
ncbi:amidohydrolase family protein [Massilia sp. UMI-21]|nr:amidohydrolase family protein [Massilia sp. UMI-21]